LILFLKRKNIPLILVIACLFLTEAILALWTENQYDMTVWFQTGVWMSQGINIYVPSNHLGYPPLWAFWCLASNRIYAFFGNNMEIWRFSVKLPMILAQFALAFVVKSFAQKRFDQKTTQKIFLVTLSWGFIIYVGALWGQLDVISALLTFLAFYSLISKRTLLGAIFLGAAVTLKIYPLITLPAFAIYLWKNRGKKETGKFVLVSGGLPVAFTLSVFAAYNWNIIYFFKTILYWTPANPANPVQIQGGCMNIWSFLSLVNIDISQISFLRLVWIPIIAAAALYWFRKGQMDDADLNLALISFFLLFMLSYAWVPEQMFLDPLPFLFLQIIGYNAKRSLLYALVVVQILVLAFSAFNWGPFIFAPLFSRFSPKLLEAIQFLNPSNPLVWNIRGLLGLAVTVGLSVFLVALSGVKIFGKTRTRNSENH
jgi:hypothetical protein